MSAFTDLLQNREKFVQEIVDGVGLGAKLRALTLLAALSFATYGLIIGSQHSLLQALSSSVKLPVLFLLTNAICLPTLFIFGSFFGSKTSLSQIAALLLVGTAMMGIVLVGFAPVTLFFTVTTGHYLFLKLLSVAFFAVAGVLGVVFFNRFLTQAMGRVINPPTSDGGEPSLPVQAGEMNDSGKRASQLNSGAKSVDARAPFLRFWFLLYAFVGTQLAWTLRPFFGSPDEPFAFFRGLGGNFYSNVISSLGQVLGAR